MWICPAPSTRISSCRVRWSTFCARSRSWQALSAGVQALSQDFALRMHVFGSVSAATCRTLLQLGSVFCVPPESCLPASFVPEAMSCGIVSVLLGAGNGPLRLSGSPRGAPPYRRTASVCRGLQDAGSPDSSQRQSVRDRQSLTGGRAPRDSRVRRPGLPGSRGWARTFPRAFSVSYSL